MAGHTALQKTEISLGTEYPMLIESRFMKTMIRISGYYEMLLFFDQFV